jgi:hypothetical protein
MIKVKVSTTRRKFKRAASEKEQTKVIIKINKKFFL